MQSLTSSVGETCDADGRWQQRDEMVEVVKDAATVHTFRISETDSSTNRKSILSYASPPAEPPLKITSVALSMP